MQERYLSLSLQQTAEPPPSLTVSDDWVFGITPDRGYTPQLPAPVHTYEQKHGSKHVPQDTASHAKWGQSEALHHSQLGSASAESTVDAEAGEQEAPLAASLVAVSSSAHPANACAARVQVASPPASSVAVSSSTQPAHAVPASVKEAVDRFESWTLEQAAVVPPEPLLTHTQQHMQQTQQEQMLQQAQAQQQAQQQTQQQTQQQQQQQRLPTLVLQQEQAVLPWRGSGVSQSTEPTSCIPLSLSRDASASSCLTYQRKQEVLEPILSQSNQQASSLSTGSICMRSPASCLQPEPARQQQPQSSASMFIEATLAAINADQSLATQELRGPVSSAIDLTTSAPNHTADLASQAPMSQADGSVVQPSRPVEGCVQRPPLPAKRAGQTFLTRPRFADAFANPSLYQQPWLQAGARSAGADSAPCSHIADVGQGRCAGHSSGPTVHSRHATAQREAGSSGHTPHTGTAAVASSAQHPSIRDTGSLHQADLDRTTLPPANRSPTQTLAGDATCSQGLNDGRRASRVTNATEQSAGEARHGSRSDDVGEPGRTGSRWSAVNAYRQAREAAVRAAAGNLPATARAAAGNGPAARAAAGNGPAARAAAGADPTGTIPKLCSFLEIDTSRLSQ